MSPLAFEVTYIISYKRQGRISKEVWSKWFLNSKGSKTSWEQFLREDTATNSRTPQFYCSLKL